MKESIKNICDRCLKEFKEDQKGYWFHDLDYVLKNLIKEKHNKDKEDYFLCANCNEIYELEEFKSNVKSLRQTKCSLCQIILLKENEQSALYYLLVELDPNDKEKDKKIETPICLDCWEKNKARYYLDKYWIEMLVNPDRIMGFAFGKERTIDLKL